MNTPSLHHKEPLHHRHQLLLERVLEALQETTGLAGTIVAIEPDLGQGVRADATIEINLAGKPYRYMAEIKRIDRFAAISQIKNQLDRFQQPGLLVAPRITIETADKCRELGVQFIDANGNAYLDAPGLFVLVKGQRLRPDQEAASGEIEVPRSGTATALRVVFALLCHPKLINAPYREINQAAGVALGAVGRVFFDLNKRGFTTGGIKKGERRVIERRRLLDEWVTNYPIKLRPKLNPRRFHAPDPEWWRHVDITRYSARWGGEIAADRLSGHLRPNTCTVYLAPEEARQNLTKLVVENKLRADPTGEIEVLNTFWNFSVNSPDPAIVPAILVYADLLASMDPRNQETARMIYEQEIHDPDATG